MPAFMKVGDIKGMSTDKKHKDWILLEAMSSPIYRSIPQGAKDNTRWQGDTTLGDVVVTRTVDKSSTKLQEACANGTPYDEVQIDFCTQSNDAAEPYMVYKLKNVIITSYSFHGSAGGSPKPSEQLTFNYTAVDWTYKVLNPDTGKPEGDVPASFKPGAHAK